MGMQMQVNKIRRAHKSSFPVCDRFTAGLPRVRGEIETTYGNIGGLEALFKSGAGRISIKNDREARPVRRVEKSLPRGLQKAFGGGIV